MRQRLRLAGAAAVALLATGCFWPAPGANSGRTAHNPFEDEITVGTVGDLEELWTTTVGQDGWTVHQPVTSKHGVHVLSTFEDQDGILMTLGRDAGGSAWFSPAGTGGSPVQMSPPIVANDTVWLGLVLGFIRGSVRRLDPDTSSRISTPGVQGLVNGVRGDLYLVTTPNRPLSPDTAAHMVAVEDLNGASGWAGSIDTAPGHNAGYSPLTLGNDYVFQAGPGTFWDGSAPGSGLSRGNGIRGYSIEDPVNGCAPGGPLTFICPTWGTELDGTTATSPVIAHEEAGIADDIVYTGTDAGTMYAVDATNGDILWSTDVGDGVGAEPALADGTLYVPTTDGHLVVLDADDGNLLWEAILPDSATLQPAVAGDVVYVASDNTVEAYPAEGCGVAFCDPLWADAPGNTITGAPAVDRGQLYLGTDNGGVIAYGLP